jgi:hypothetical protein
MATVLPSGDEADCKKLSVMMQERGQSRLRQMSKLKSERKSSLAANAMWVVSFRNRIGQETFRGKIGGSENFAGGRQTEVRLTQYC